MPSACKGRAERKGAVMDFRRALILLVMDVLIIAELTAAIWWAHFVPEEISWRFIQVFLPAAGVTILVTRFAFKRWAPKVKVSTGSGEAAPWRPVSLFGALGNPVRFTRRDG